MSYKTILPLLPNVNICRRRIIGENFFDYTNFPIIMYCFIFVYSLDCHYSRSMNLFLVSEKSCEFTLSCPGAYTCKCMDIIVYSCQLLLLILKLIPRQPLSFSVSKLFPSSFVLGMWLALLFLNPHKWVALGVPINYTFNLRGGFRP